jgi:hypothetical protein
MGNIRSAAGLVAASVFLSVAIEKKRKFMPVVSSGWSLIVLLRVVTR